MDSYAEAEAMLESKKEGHLPFFREKPQIKPIEEGKPAQLACLAVGSPKPVIQWYKNDMMVQETNRIKITEDQDGRSILSFNPTKEHDVGSYKVVARNSLGQTVVRTRIVEAFVPSGPDSPEVRKVIALLNLSADRNIAINCNIQMERSLINSFSACRCLRY